MLIESTRCGTVPVSHTPFALAAKRIATWYILIIGSLSLYLNTYILYMCVIKYNYIYININISCSVIDRDCLLAYRIAGEPGPGQRAGSELFGPRTLVWLGSPRTTANRNSMTRDDQSDK